MKNFFLIFVTIFLLTASPVAVSASGVDKYGLGYGQNAGLGTRDVRDTVASLIRSALGILGVLMLVLIIAGVVTAKPAMIGAAVAGLIVIFIGYALNWWIFGVLENAT